MSPFLAVLIKESFRERCNLSMAEQPTELLALIQALTGKDWLVLNCQLGNTAPLPCLPPEPLEYLLQHSKGSGHLGVSLVASGLLLQLRSWVAGLRIWHANTSLGFLLCTWQSLYKFSCSIQGPGLGSSISFSSRKVLVDRPMTFRQWWE